MANIKSQKKRVITNEKKRKANASFKSEMRTAIKKVHIAYANKDLEALKANLPHTLSLIDKAVKKNIVHANWASRNKSTLMTFEYTLEHEGK